MKKWCLAGRYDAICMKEKHPPTEPHHDPGFEAGYPGAHPSHTWFDAFTFQGRINDLTFGAQNAMMNA